MSRAVALLISLLLALGPAAALADAGCVCLATTVSESGSVDSIDGCCGPADGEEPSAPDEPEPVDERPCSGLECSLVCCGTVKNLAAPQRSAPVVSEKPRLRSATAPTTRRGSAHVLELKRPPRPNPRA